MQPTRSYGAAYRRAVFRQRLLRGTKGFEAAVGGSFDRIGGLERQALESAGLPGDGFVVDVGCGSGRLAHALKSLPELRYLGLDVSPALLEHARAVCGRRDWRFERVFAPAIPADNGSADIVSMFSLITHLPNAETRAYFAEAHRVLKPGGALVVSFLDPVLAQHRKHLRPRRVEAIVTRLVWAPNVATAVDDLRAWAHAAGFMTERIESPSALGQSLAVLRRPVTAEGGPR